MNKSSLKVVLRSMLEEDDYLNDLTSSITPNKSVKAEIISRQNGMLAGVAEVKELFSLGNIRVLSSAKDGFPIQKNQTVIRISGASRNILSYERTALNILSRMSGIATLTLDYVVKARMGNPRVIVAATRKTTPLFRYFEKKAVVLGGGHPHRFSLGDAVLIKDNHLLLFESAVAAVEAAREKYGKNRKIEIETSNIEEALEAAMVGADIIMLDNFPPHKIKGAIKKLEAEGLRKKAVLEASGGITLENITSYAKTGVDVISVGALTHSASSLDFSLNILK
ncbi:MAG: carboxylating nicotinate-nucleotide diphosphorylase [Candidatus Altiarchaeota archaeon]